MTTLTIPQFIALLNSARIATSHDVHEVVAAHDDDHPPMVTGAIWNDLTIPGLKIAYCNGYEHPEGKPSLVKTSKDIPDVWLVESQALAVHHEDGDVLSTHELGELLLAHSNVDAFDFEVLGDDMYEEIDTDEDTDMNTIIVKRDNDRDIKFTGEEIASASSSADTARSDFSGSTGRWTDLFLYRTQGGKYICSQVGHTQWQGEKTRYGAAICDNVEAVVAFFGTGWLAKKLYENANIDASVQVD